MHLSMHNWMRAEPLEVTLARLSKYGYESIEISGEPDQYRPDEVRPLLEKYNLRCWGSVTLMLGNRSLVAGDEAARRESVQYTKDCIDLVGALNGSEMTIVPATVGKIVPDSNPEQEWEWAVAGLKEIYEHAQPQGVRLAIEPLNRFETYFINRGAQAMALAEAVGGECGVCLDAFHINIEEQDLFQTIVDCGPRLADFHVADNNRMPAGMGHYDWKRVVETLKSVGYDGALTAEFVAPVDRTPANPYPNALETEPVDISAEQMQFIVDHGSTTLSEEFYDWLVEKNAEHLLPLI
uniref:D-Tagatose 3-epimerase n=1 Tax=uncultured Nocardioidaceae bacterium TaxID=253824 RepID=A0A6J4KV70_9ACTN|nr:MAG: D-Tagatose 3-epimerase [uncultured Nocardioidaceae bacterium]